LIKAMRLPFLTGSLVPVLVVAAWAWGREPLSWERLLLTLIGVGCLQVGANLINDYFDAMGSDPINRFITPFSGGSRVIQEGSLSSRAVLNLSVGFFLAAGACGILLALAGRPWALAVGVFGFLAGFLYSATPVALMSRGLGELVIFAAFGPVLTWGAGYALSGRFSLESCCLGLPQAWLITAVLWINQFPDFSADRTVGKLNLVVRMGTKAARLVYTALMILPFPTILFLWRQFHLSAWIGLAWLALPLALAAVRVAWLYHDDPQKIVPAQGMTIIAHLAVGLLLALGLLL
jgi:1,4-dihydroxy-2-naphthoate octaprenyltransferase